MATEKGDKLRMHHKISILVLAVFLLWAKPNRAGVIYSIIAGISTEPTQLMNNIELLGINVAEWQEIAQQLEQLANEATMIENQLTNLLTLADNPLAFINTLEQLSRVVQQGQVLSYAAQNIDAQYANKYPGYPTYRYQAMSSSLLQQKYMDWSQHNMDNIKAALKASNIQEQTILDERSRLETIINLSKSAEGRLQALQAGNLIAGEQASSLLRLRQLAMANNQLMANYQAKEQDKEDIGRASWQKITDTVETKSIIVGDEGNILGGIQ